MKFRLIPQMPFGILVLLLSLSGCNTQISQLAIEYSLPTNSTIALEDISKINPQQIEELSTLSHSGVTETIIAMAQVIAEDKFSAVYSDGDVRLWDLQTKDIISEYNVGLVSKETASFSDDGLSLITPHNILSASVESEYEKVKVIDGINLWDTRTGTQIGCFGFHCQPEREQYQSATVGSTLSPQGDWIVKYGETSLYIIHTTGKLPNVIFNLYYPDSTTKQHISKLSFDPTGEYFAVAYEEGNITIYRFNSVIDNNNIIKALSISKVQDIRRPVISMRMDPTRTWLALLYENELQVWDLKSMKNKPSISSAIPSMNTIAFDQSGNLLVVGTKFGLRFIDLRKRSEVAYFDDNEVASMYITTDNRLLVWGDTKGIIHLWGAKLP